MRSLMVANGSKLMRSFEYNQKHWQLGRAVYVKTLP